jgi:acyl transferase domain-containing protein
VRFAEGIAELLREPGRILLEAGPGRALSILARRQARASTVVLAGSEPELLLGSLGHLWLAGAEVDWDRFQVHERRRRVRLPLYPFERQRYWIEARPVPAPGEERLPVDDGFSAPQQAPAEKSSGPETEHSRPELATPYAAPRTDTERVLAGIWEDVLGIRPVGIHDDFYELGGHSLLALQVLSRVRQALGAELPLRAIFDAPTVARLAVRILEGEARTVDGGELDQLLARLEGLSDAEAEALLADEGLLMEAGADRPEVSGD